MLSSSASTRAPRLPGPLIAIEPARGLALRIERVRCNSTGHGS